MTIPEIITVFAIMATNIGTVLMLYFQLDRKLDEGRRDTQDIIRSIQEEMKDFHARLCVIEERGRK